MMKIKGTSCHRRHPSAGSFFLRPENGFIFIHLNTLREVDFEIKIFFIFFILKFGQNSNAVFLSPVLKLVEAGFGRIEPAWRI